MTMMVPARNYTDWDYAQIVFLEAKGYQFEADRLREWYQKRDAVDVEVIEETDD